MNLWNLYNMDNKCPSFHFTTENHCTDQQKEAKRKIIRFWFNILLFAIQDDVCQGLGYFAVKCNLCPGNLSPLKILIHFLMQNYLSLACLCLFSVSAPI